MTPFFWMPDQVWDGNGGGDKLAGLFYLAASAAQLLFCTGGGWGTSNIQRSTSNLEADYIGGICLLYCKPSNRESGANLRSKRFGGERV